MSQHVSSSPNYLFSFFIILLFSSTICSTTQQVNKFSSLKSRGGEQSAFGYFLWMTDIHYDPFYDPTIPNHQYFCRKPQQVVTENQPERVQQEFHHLRNTKQKIQDFLFIEEKRKILIRNSSSPSFEGIDTNFTDYAMYGRYGCDAPKTLVESTFSQIAQVIREHNGILPDFIVMNGDYNAHHLPNGSFVLQNTLDVTKMLQSTLAKQLNVYDLPILPCIGNNDLYPDYYLPYIEDPDHGNEALTWYQSLWTGPVGWGKMFGLTEDYQRNTFLKGGYYKYEIVKTSQGRESKLVILVLNSLLYSANRYPNMTNGAEPPSDPSGQLAWMEMELLKARSELSIRDVTVYIVTHIPASQNSFDNKSLWKPMYESQFLALVSKYSEMITTILYGHLHKDQFRLFRNQQPNKVNDLGNTKNNFAMVGLSVSPVFSNNVGFRTLYYSEKYLILDYDQYYMDIYSSNQKRNAVWKKGYTFSKAFPTLFEEAHFINSLLVQSFLKKLEQSYQEDDQQVDYLTQFMGYKEAQYVANRFKYFCDITMLEPTEFIKCIATGSDSGAIPIQKFINRK
ncbi:predicted protein [Naegleria gruberi]|uniref:Predicted protein n=1 Tax=Naegleria gruberi TaxID=5762 RepID=D2V7L8_NAEGR|nr:uncharacterized protein NAEGRDRAFT_47320 [Naegleria gruberi]EFC47403.1 predicted protein [Naegleria gruberi]|eukprot:XP_002680147.1 predicted protein [Naegleria gruberi strain NEG-M]